jgi:hypothetical protein
MEEQFSTKPDHTGIKSAIEIVSALRGFAAVETSKNQLSRNFWSRSIFDFFATVSARSGHS